MADKFVPTERGVFCMDKLSKKLFELDADIWEQMIVAGGSFSLVEHKEQRTREGVVLPTIMTPFWLSRMDKDITPLTLFDFANLTACISEFVAGNSFTTVNAIFRFVAGKPSGKATGTRYVATKNQAVAIEQSLQLLMNTQLRIDMSEVCRRFHYNGGKPLKLDEKILPARFINTYVNGSPCRVIEFKAEPPNLTIAKSKESRKQKCQIQTFDRMLLASSTSSTVDAVAVKFYLLRRLLEITKHKMTPSIVFDNLLKDCHLKDVGHKQKMKLINEIKGFAEQFQAMNWIKAVEIISQKRIPYSLKIDR